MVRFIFGKTYLFIISDTTCLSLLCDNKHTITYKHSYIPKFSLFIVLTECIAVLTTIHFETRTSMYESVCYSLIPFLEIFFRFSRASSFARVTWSISKSYFGYCWFLFLQDILVRNTNPDSKTISSMIYTLFGFCLLGRCSTKWARRCNTRTRTSRT